MSEPTQSSHYKGIFKSTALFGFVQVFKAIIGVINNKLVAILLGPDGVGLMGIFYTAIGFLQTGAGFGINQSAVREISEAYGSDNKEKFSKIISITKRIVLFTGLLGCVATIILSPWLSEWTLGNTGYTLTFICFGLVVAFNIMTEGQLAILKGMRQLRSLAKASMIGSVVGLITGIPLFYFFGQKGIVPQIIIASGLALFFANYFVKKINYNKSGLTIKEVFREATPMLKMGMALMFVSFLQNIVALVIASYMRSNGGLEIVGYYSAGATIMGSYFGVIITALMTDYYPRISAVNKDNAKLQDELNRQSAVSLVLSCPLVVIFLNLLPLFIKILYTEDFLPTVDFLKFGIYGTLITICSNQVDMILVVKYKIKLFTILAILIRIIHVGLSIILFKYFGLMGMGIMLAVLGIIHMAVMTIAVYNLYGIIFNRFFVKLAIVVLAFSISASLSCEITNVAIKYSIGALLTVTSIMFSYLISKKYFEIDIIKIITSKLKT